MRFVAPPLNKRDYMPSWEELEYITDSFSEDIFRHYLAAIPVHWLEDGMWQMGHI